MDRQAYHVGLTTPPCSSTSIIAAKCLTTKLRTPHAPLCRAPRGNALVVHCSSDTQEDVAAANSMQWLWDRKASLTKERVKSRDVRARKYVELSLWCLYEHAL